MEPLFIGPKNIGWKELAEQRKCIVLIAGRGDGGVSLLVPAFIGHSCQPGSRHPA
jgi:hypothetical protein